MYPALSKAIDELEVPVDGQSIVAFFAEIDRMHSIAAEVLGRFDAAKLWDLDDAVSLQQWLRTRTGYTNNDASKIARTAQRLHELPVTLSAWRDGSLTSAQVDIVLANVSEERAELFAEHEAEIVPSLVGSMPARRR